MAIKLYNTLSREKEEVRPLHNEWVGLYTCGPTVYNYAHIGNLRTYIFEDILERALTYNGFKVKRVMNITDVGHLTSDADAGEDKLDREARAANKPVQEIARFYTRAFLDDLEKLNIKIPEIIAPATEFVQEQIAIIEELFKKGFAYDTGTAVYFDVGKFKNYGKLSGQPLSEKLTGARAEVVVDAEKRNAADFALWFKLAGRFKNHLLHWPSPWGEGFPGWHIECSAISKHFLGQPFDIHTGGVDHIGTHHTNEIAQSEAAYGVPLANVWMHGEYLIINEGRMGKSEGNFITLSDLINKGYHPLAFRYLVLNTHYRSKLNFTWEGLDAARSGLKNLYRSIYVMLLAVEKLEKPGFAIMPEENERKAAEFENQFLEGLNDDLNTPKSLAVIYKVIQRKDISGSERMNLLAKFDRILGLELAEKPKKSLKRYLETGGNAKKLAEEREEFRANQQFMQADDLRKQIDALGYEVDDTPHGPILWPRDLI